jgi:glucose-1-phosphate adenylyltransferase
MDYMKFVDHHRATGADITIGALPVDAARASDFGLMKVDDSGRIVEFAEKPKGEALARMAVDTTVLGLAPDDARERPYIASMGIYVFKKVREKGMRFFFFGRALDALKLTRLPILFLSQDVLTDLLTGKYAAFNDFGGEIIPAAADEKKVVAYLFDGYWEDIGTIKSFFDANLALAQQPPRFEFYDQTAPIYTSPRFLPPAKGE